MRSNRWKIRAFYVALCLVQLEITGRGLALAYYIERSYSRNIEYETTVRVKQQILSSVVFQKLQGSTWAFVA